MDKILIYENRKQDPCGWDISTPELEQKAWLALFRYLDQEWQLFGMLRDMKSRIYEEAKKGDWKAARAVLDYSSNWEYGGYKIITLEQG